MKGVASSFALGMLIFLAVWEPSVAQMEQPLATFSGAVQQMDGKTIALLDSTDANTLQFVCTHKTRYFDGTKRIKASDIRPGDRVSIETKRFPDGELEAINVRRERKKPS
jgi:hypothetical protein